MVFTVTTIPPSSSEITYSWATSSESDDTATEGVDYTKSADGVTIAADVTESTFNVPIIGDYIVEGNEMFTVTLSNASGASLLVPQVKGTIIDDDALPVVTITADNGSVNENEGPSEFRDFCY